MLVSQEYDSSEPEELKIDDSIDCEVVWAKIKIRGSSDLYIGSFYRAPDKTKPDYLEHLQSKLARIPTDKGAHLWIGGDFNLPDINWDDESVLPYATCSSVSKQLLHLAKDAYLDQMVTQPTRITETTANTLDLFFTSNATLINKVETIPGISDHEAVFIESSLRPMKVKVSPRKVFQYRKADYEGMKRELRATQHDFQQMAETEDTEHLWTTFKKKTHSLMDKFIPSKMLRGNKSQKPWVTKQVKGLRRKQKVLFKRQHKTGAAKDIRQYRETKARLQKGRETVLLEIYRKHSRSREPRPGIPTEAKEALQFYKVTSKRQQRHCSPQRKGPTPR